MKKAIISRLFEALLLIVIYFATHLNNPYAAFIMLAFVWGSIVCVLIVLLAVVLSKESEGSKMFNRTRSRTTMSKLYSYTYDALVCCLLLYFGYVFTAFAWALIPLAAAIYISKPNKLKTHTQ